MRGRTAASEDELRKKYGEHYEPPESDERSARRASAHAK